MRDARKITMQMVSTWRKERDMTEDVAPTEPTQEELSQIPPAAPRMTLEMILQAMQNFDEQLVLPIEKGELQLPEGKSPEELRTLLMSKIDGYKFIIDRLDSEAKFFREQAAPLMSTAYTLEKEADGVAKLLTFVMQKMGFDELPGTAWRAALQDNGTPAFEITQTECTAFDFQKYPSYVKQVRHYEWDQAAIRTALIDARKAAKAIAEASKLPAPRGEFRIPTLPMAKLTVGRHMKFWPNRKKK
jgi:hypothetical protein